MTARARRKAATAAEAAVKADVAAARLIQAIECRMAELADPRVVWPTPEARIVAVMRTAGVGMTTGQRCGWEAQSLYHGTDPWDAGWLAAAYFGYEPCEQTLPEIAERIVEATGVDPGSLDPWDTLV